MPEKLRVLELITNFSLGGAETHLALLCEKLGCSDIEVEAAFLKEGVAEQPSMRPRFDAAGIRVHDLGMRSRLDLAAVVRLRSLLLGGRFDILHTHLFRADLIGLLGRPSDVAWVSSVHNEEQPLLRLPWRWLVRMCVRRQARTIAISDAVKRFLVGGIGVEADKVTVVHYGYELPAQLVSGKRDRARARQALGVPRDCLLIGTLGRLAPQKGHRHLVDALARVADRVPSVCLAIGGPDWGGLRVRLEEQAAALGLSERIVFPGFIRSSVLLSASDIFAFPSLWEGFGLAQLEAMAYGLPIVGTTVGAIPEVVLDGQTGILVPPGDPQALAEALVRLALDRHLAARMGAAGRQRLKAEFSADTMAARTVAVYREAVPSSQA